MSKYKVGFYGGKFLPMHTGHKFCIDVAASECDTLYVILFVNGRGELDILKGLDEEYATIESRWNILSKLAKEYSNVIPAIVDVANCKYEDGEEDWDAETPLVRAVVGDKLDAVYSSEVSYDEYFKKAYPEAEHRLVDPPRKIVPISSTKIRAMTLEEERAKWMIKKEL